MIESAGAKSGKARVIKSHHNVGGLPEYMKLELVEPLRELFKDEVRKIGVELGLPDEMIYRHPFPGPGLGVRILGEVNKAYADLLRQADHIYIEELNKHNLYDEVSQVFAVFLPVKSVGVVGDARMVSHVFAEGRKGFECGITTKNEAIIKCPNRTVSRDLSDRCQGENHATTGCWQNNSL